jgi:alpha-beta hydrolase superfamily lysophospholipase
MLRSLMFIIVALVLVVAVRHFWTKTPDVGHPDYFSDQTYNFETIRVLDDIAVAGGDNNEAAQAIRGIKVDDADGWFAAWKAAGDRATALAARTQDPISRGDALLRAHTYYRSAEFFLAPADARRPAIWKLNVDSFYDALNVLGVRHERINVPYGDAYHLNSVYFPGPAGAEKRPLLVAMTGYDGTMEELYASVVAAALQHGYSVLIFEGPGQGSVIREQHLVFQPDWEKPNGAVLDAFLANHPRPAHIVEIGESMGGYLAPRAAAFDSRIDGVVAYDVFYDGYAVASRHVPQFAFWLRDHGYNKLLNFLAQRGKDPGSEWAQQNGQWVLGASGPFELLDAFKAYRLAPVADRIKADVLILAGADDHFVPPDQLDQFRDSLTQAHSVTAIEFDRASGGSQHCQLGAPSLWHAALFDWLQAKFP